MVAKYAPENKFVHNGTKLQEQGKHYHNKDHVVPQIKD